MKIISLKFCNEGIERGLVFGEETFKRRKEEEEILAYQKSLINSSHSFELTSSSMMSFAQEIQIQQVCV